MYVDLFTKSFTILKKLARLQIYKTLLAQFDP